MKKAQIYYMRQESILEGIKHAVENLNWTSETKKQKALKLCISIFNLYTYDGGNFYVYKRIPRNYFIDILKTKSYIQEIKLNLINNGILEVYKPFGKETYDTKNHLSKGYRFNQKLIGGSFTTNISTLSKSSTISYMCPKLFKSMKSTLHKLTISPKINDYFDNFQLTKSHIKINNEIINSHVDIQYENELYRYTIENALKQAKENKLDLIQYKDKCYIDNVSTFLIRKTHDLKLIYRKSIFDVENKLFRVSINITNRRLDYNLTNMKSDLLKYLLLEGEELIELDMANAQFTILSHIEKDLDKNFIKQTQNGTLYNTISKDRWFYIAFGKIQQHDDDVRELYPLTMKFIDEYKKQNGYKLFSNLLQKKESEIMIDGLLTRLIELGYDVLPIHDAIRVKKSQVDIIKKEVNKYFKEINFKCNLRNKNN